MSEAVTEPSALSSREAPPADAAPSRGLLLTPRGLSIPRTALAMGGSLAALAALVFGLDGALDPLIGVEIGLLGLATLLIPIDRVDAHVLVRSVLWGTLALGALDTLDPEARGLALLLGSAVSLLALGGAGLDGEHAGFAPKVLRRSLLTMMVGAVSMAHVLTVGALSIGPHWSVSAIGLVTPALLLVSVVGLSRTRSWGLLAYLGALFAAGAAAAAYFYAPLPWGHVEFFDMPELFGGAYLVAGSTTLLLALPVLAALVFKPRPRPTGRRWGVYVHAAMVLGATGAALYGAYVLNA